MEKALFTKSRANIKGAGVVRGFPEKTLRDFYYVIFRQKRKITLFLCIVIVATALLTFLGLFLGILRHGAAEPAVFAQVTVDQRETEQVIA